jgi:hypothetical protein
MSLLDKLLKKTAVTAEDTDKMLSEAVRDLTKSLKYEDDEEDEGEKKKAKKKYDDEEEIKAKKKKKDYEDEDEEEEEYKSKKTKKGKKDVEDFIEDDVDVEDDFPYDEPEDEEDEEAEEEAAEREKEIAKRSQKKSRKKNYDYDVDEVIEEDQDDVYFDDEDDEDLPEEEFDIPEEQGHEKGIITNYGRRIKGKTKKSFNDDAMSDVVEMLADVALLLEATLKQNQKMAKSLVAMMKSQQKINADMELIKSQSPTYPMLPLMYMPTISTKKNTNGKEYSEEQVREALVKGMTAGQVSGDLLRDFEAYISKPGAKVTDWVNDMLDEPIKKTLGL